jgi:hypothetical protein
VRTNITVKTKIRVNGQDYGSVDALPPDLRQAYERALASMSAQTADKLALGSTQTKVAFNGQEYGSVDEMPAAARRLYEGVMATVDANRNGIPDALETTAQGPNGSSLGPTSMTASVAGGIVRPDSTRGWLVIALVVVAAMLLGAFVFGR